MFFEFPGILITIGVILLLISIIIIIVAYRSDNKDVDASKLSTNYHRRDDDVIPREDDKKEETLENKPQGEVLENKPTETKEDPKKDLEKTKIFKPAELMPKEQNESLENSGERPMGLKDLLEGINKVDEKKELDKEELIDIFDKEFKTENKEKTEKIVINEEKELKEEQKELSHLPEEDEDIELL